ncbi:hypothetical protein [Dokdonia sp.]|uniref:hypothetical protein n=1 Tax=Dokdonia sp. TaxID=2024995 RepID=UPI0032652850
MKHIYLFILFLVFSGSLFGQKKLFKEYDAKGIETLFIESDEIFQIKLTTSQTDKISIYTVIEGETFESSLLNTKRIEKQLNITTGRTPDFIPFNDKLSAHKILSIVLEITIPEYMTIDIYSALASVEASGNYKNVRINLDRGGCQFSNFSFRESAYINTISGNIHIRTTQVQIVAQSRNGNIVIPYGMTGDHAIHLKSIHGDITVENSQ